MTRDTDADGVRRQRIQEVAAEVGLTARSIRYYEEVGLLEPAARSEGAYRLYDADDVARLRFIKGLRDDAGFSLAEIGQLLEDETARAANRVRFRASRRPAARRAVLLDGMARVGRVVAAVQWLPVLVLGLFGGLIADALPKRRTMLVTQGFAAILSLTMAILVISGTVAVWHVIVVAFLLGIRNAVDLPTRQSFAVEMVGREDVGNAVALNSAMFNGARVIGPAVAGITIGAFGVGAAFLIDAISYLAVIVALLAMRETDLHTRPGIERPTTMRAALGNLAEGLGYVRRTRLVL